ncbi:hypothetical protein AAGS40_10340 [Paraburkholderia sp. PREW-6R]
MSRYAAVPAARRCAPGIASMPVGQSLARRQGLRERLATAIDLQ